MLLLRRQSKGFVRTSSKFRAITKDRVRCAGTINSSKAGWMSIHCPAAATFCDCTDQHPQFCTTMYTAQSINDETPKNLIMLSHFQATDPENLSRSIRMHVQRAQISWLCSTWRTA